MEKKFLIEMLPAKDGDCLLVSWGDDEKLHYMVVDGGRAGAYAPLKERLSDVAQKGEQLELYVLTHIDADHIEGGLSYLKDRQKPIVPKRVWFNGYRQMVPSHRRSMTQGDDYSEQLEKLEWPLNSEFANGIVSMEDTLGVIDVAGLKITLLSPDKAHLSALGEKWKEFRRELEAKKEEKEREGMRGGRERPPIVEPITLEDLIADGELDPELPNGTSIAFVAEWEGHRVLFGGDAHPDLLAASLAPLATAEGGRYRIDLYKASHHGSTKNTSRELIQLMDCSRMAVSTNGALHGHPDPQSIARFIYFGPVGSKMIYFNYDTERTRPWDDEKTKAKYSYKTRFPPKDAGVLEIDVLADDLSPGS
ncbi:hypothetical protein AB5I39_08795 [Sphingomonas sp. MMS24-J45]|uniref:hypothetical protein n=1 Tax=Sphingomonas sp. MMS24-J45 TaxID=3238806 RepID=UPI00385118A7